MHMCRAQLGHFSGDGQTDRTECNKIKDEILEKLDVDDCPGGAGTKGGCSGRGSCVDGLHTYSCQCDAGYEGDTCQTAKACTAGPGGATCANNGVPSGTTGFVVIRKASCTQHFEKARLPSLRAVTLLLPSTTDML